MFKTQSQYSWAHRITGLVIPILVMSALHTASWAAPVSGAAFIIGAILLILKIRFQWRDSLAFDHLIRTSYPLEKYTVKNRIFFIDDLAIDAYQAMALENGLVLQINKDKTKAHVDKSRIQTVE